MKFVLLLLALAAPSQGAIIETPDLKTCLTEVQSKLESSPQEILFAFDIDNTVLELKHNLGSVQWYRWQRNLIERDESEGRVAVTTDELLMKQAWIYQMSSTRAPEEFLANDLGELQSKGHPIIFHTSRNTDVRGLTERELRLNSFVPLKSTIGPDSGYPGEFKFSPEQRPVSFQNGVYMSAGQDKGIFLKLLLSKVKFVPKGIVFVDDEKKNLENVERALGNVIPLVLCRYGKVDSRVEAFNKSNKSEEIQLWNVLSTVTSKLADY